MSTHTNIILNMRRQDTIMEGFEESRRFSQKVVVGRSAECDWCIQDGYVSSRHAYFFQEGDRWFITDTSTNGVFINQGAEPLGKNNQIILEEGDEILIGDYIFIVEFESVKAKEKNYGHMYDSLQKTTHSPPKAQKTPALENPFVEEIDSFEQEILTSSQTRASQIKIISEPKTLFMTDEEENSVLQEGAFSQEQIQEVLPQEQIQEVLPQEEQAQKISPFKEEIFIKKTSVIQEERSLSSNEQNLIKMIDALLKIIQNKDSFFVERGIKKYTQLKESNNSWTKSSGPLELLETINTHPSFWHDLEEHVQEICDFQNSVGRFAEESLQFWMERLDPSSIEIVDTKVPFFKNVWNDALRWKSYCMMYKNMRSISHEVSHRILELKK